MLDHVCLCAATKTSTARRNGCVCVAWVVVRVLFVGSGVCLLFSVSIKTKEMYLSLLFVVTDEARARGTTCCTASSVPTVLHKLLQVFPNTWFALSTLPVAFGVYEAV